MTTPERGTNLLDSVASICEGYEGADGKFASVGPVERSSGKMCTDTSG